MLEVLGRWEPGPPRLIWYGDDGERVELSGRVLLNWVVKAANLLAELDVTEGSRVALDLPPHWRLLVWELAVRALGADTILTAADDEPSDDVDLVATSRPDRWDGVGVDVVAVALPALARAWSGALPAGAVDGAAELMGQPDVPTFAAAPRPGVAGVTERRLVPATDPGDLVATAWSCWSADGSVVVVTPRDPDAVAAIAAQEGTGDGQGTLA